MSDATTFFPTPTSRAIAERMGRPDLAREVSQADLQALDALKGLIVGFDVEEIYEKVDEPDTMEAQAHGGALRRPGAKRVAVGRIVKVKLSERIKRTELIGKHVDVKAFEDRVAVSGMESVVAGIERAAKAHEEGMKREIAEAIRRDREGRKA